MPSQPDETPAQDLAHVIQYAQLASVALCDARRSAGHRNIILTITEENELLDYLNGIEERAKAARAKLGIPEPPPDAYLADGLVKKLLRYYDCVTCSKRHWEDERPIFDEHILGACAPTGTGAGGIGFAHRPDLEIVR